MKSINLDSGESAFYTLKETINEVVDKVAKGTAKITGYHFGEINEGDELICNRRKYIVTSDIFRRNCRGVFKEEYKRKNSFFELTATFEKFVSA